MSRNRLGQRLGIRDSACLWHSSKLGIIYSKISKRGSLQDAPELYSFVSTSDGVRLFSFSSNGIQFKSLRLHSTPAGGLTSDVISKRLPRRCHVEVNEVADRADDLGFITSAIASDPERNLNFFA